MGSKGQNFKKTSIAERVGSVNYFLCYLHATTSYVRLLIAKSVLPSFRPLASISVQARRIDLLATDGSSGIMSTFPFQSVVVDDRRLRGSETRWGFAAGDLAG